MPGTVVFKPIEANITHNTELIGKMDPYCLFHVGNQKIKGQVCRKGGKHPQWEDSITIPITNQPTCVVDLKDKDIIHDDKIGTFEVDLREVETQGRLKKWYPLFYKEKPAGEILIEAIYAGDSTAGISQGVPSTNTAIVSDVMPTTVKQETYVSNTIAGQPYLVDQTVGTSYVVNQVTNTTGIIGGNSNLLVEVSQLAASMDLRACLHSKVIISYQLLVELSLLLTLPLSTPIPQTQSFMPKKL